MLHFAVPWDMREVNYSFHWDEKWPPMQPKPLPMSVSALQLLLMLLTRCFLIGCRPHIDHKSLSFQERCIFCSPLSGWNQALVNCFYPAQESTDPGLVKGWISARIRFLEVTNSISFNRDGSAQKRGSWLESTAQPKIQITQKSPHRMQNMMSLGVFSLMSY